MVIDVECGSTRHTLLWRRGSLVLVDHDPVADAVVVALGGEPPECLEVLRSWRFGYVEEEVPAISAGLVRSLSSIARWMSGSGPQPVVLPEPLRRLREASLLHTWGRGLRDPLAGKGAQRDFLARAIERRVSDVVTPQAQALRAGRSGDEEIEIVVHADESKLPTAIGRADTAGAKVRVDVPSTWLTSVWVAGFESIAGGLTLAVERGQCASAEVARWTPDGDGSWELTTAWQPLA